MCRVGALILIGISSVQGVGFAEGSGKIAPWTSAVKCLAPLAREARSGENPLDLEQVFFDGPFRRPVVPRQLPVWIRGFDGLSDSEYHRLLCKGYELALMFDDREAERYFRECIESEPNRPEGYLGLTVVNSADSRRFRCFLGAARERVQAGSVLQRWVALLGEHPVVSGNQPDEWVRNVRAQLQVDRHPLFAIVWLRSLALDSLAVGGAVAKTDVPAVADDFSGLPMNHLVAAADPSRFEFSDSVPWSPLAMRLIADSVAGEGRTGDAFQLRSDSMKEELARLDRIGNIMPEATLALGPTLTLQLRTLSSWDPEGAARSARMAMTWPRDVYSVGERWRHLRRDETLWVVGRRYLAEHVLRENGVAGLEDISRGFLSSDKSEWFAWRAIGEIQEGGSFNPWLAALRREPGSDPLVETVEAYVAWKGGESDSPPEPIPGLPVEWFGGKAPPKKVPSPEKIVPLDLTPRARPAPGFSLPDGRGRVRSLDDSLGRPVVVIFFLGGGCLHCVEQLTAFGPWADRFAEAGIDLLAVSTDEVDYLAGTLSQEGGPTDTFPIPIVSDSDLVAFREWGVVDEFDDRALHGTFLVSPRGEIIWQETGNAPYMHPDFLLWEASRLLDR